MDKLEILLTEQAAIIEDLHQMVATQDREIAELRRHVRLLLSRAAESDQGDGGAVLADQKPPHW